MRNRKLDLKREVLAALTPDDLRTVAGAGQETTWTLPPTIITATGSCPTNYCTDYCTDYCTLGRVCRS